MKAFILAAGLGTRLKPWTDFHPKALAPVNGIPALEYVINKIINAGISEIIINIHHFGEQIVDFVSKKSFRAKFIYSDEKEILLETGGGLSKIIPLLENEPVIVYNSDILSNFNLDEMIKSHNISAADITLLTDTRKTVRNLIFNHDGFMLGWINNTTGEIKPAALTPPAGCLYRAFDGVHIINPKAYNMLSGFKDANVPFSLTEFYIDNCNQLRIKAFDLPANNYWFDIGKPETLFKATEFFSKN